MWKPRRSAPWKRRFHLHYAPVVGELPALIRLQSVKPRTVSSPKTVLIVNCCLIGDFVLSLPSIQDFRNEHPTAAIDLVEKIEVATVARACTEILSKNRCSPS